MSCPVASCCYACACCVLSAIKSRQRESRRRRDLAVRLMSRKLLRLQARYTGLEHDRHAASQRTQSRLLVALVDVGVHQHHLCSSVVELASACCVACCAAASLGPRLMIASLSRCASVNSTASSLVCFLCAFLVAAASAIEDFYVATCPDSPVASCVPFSWESDSRQTDRQNAAYMGSRAPMLVGLCGFCELHLKSGVDAGPRGGGQLSDSGGGVEPRWGLQPIYRMYVVASRMYTVLHSSYAVHLYANLKTSRSPYMVI